MHIKRKKNENLIEVLLYQPPKISKNCALRCRLRSVEAHHYPVKFVTQQFSKLGHASYPFDSALHWAYVSWHSSRRKYSLVTLLSITPISVLLLLKCSFSIQTRNREDFLVTMNFTKMEILIQWHEIVILS